MVTLLRLRQVGVYDIAFLTDLFNLSVDGEILAICRNSSIVHVLKVGKHGEQDCKNFEAAPSPEDCEGSRNVPLSARFKQSQSLLR